MTINYDTNYEAMKRANEIAEEKLEIFNRAIISLQEETKEAEDKRHASSPDEVAY
jgi:cation transport regulator ChaB